jgi:hypothetical protein
MSDSWHQIKYQKQMPFSVMPMKAKTAIEARAEIDLFYAKSKERNKAKAEKRRQLAINQMLRPDAWTTSGIKYPETVRKPSILARIYNWFLNLNITY